eukprot:CAMPEP_0202073830 /NCGR_PEP_ID=MMETSP0964-20121228/3260_1 /ASSEMBLY_ACC=CAM_ASM_000500 /TAXON_ID=4773 /ORGANISM="Schizochytrium aggregatum, Strain ATCC28209" /LENGTH=54 /DNA_ID=CAMNT_0048640955 /DNA_START=156 /DNA_END=317 /DNA_ORIENTATION=-
MGLAARARLIEAGGGATGGERKEGRKRVKASARKLTVNILLQRRAMTWISSSSP